MFSGSEELCPARVSCLRSWTLPPSEASIVRHKPDPDRDRAWLTPSVATLLPGLGLTRSLFPPPGQEPTQGAPVLQSSGPHLLLPPSAAATFACPRTMSLGLRGQVVAVLGLPMMSSTVPGRLTGTLATEWEGGQTCVGATPHWGGTQ